MGYSTAMIDVGYCYFYGVGIEKDEHKAFIYFEKSADMNYVRGINNVGYCYQNGIGVEKDEYKVFFYYQKSANFGDARGTRVVGYCYEKGIGVEKDGHNAFDYYQKAADVGDALGTRGVGYCYEKGIGVEKNEHKAFIYYQKSADMDNASGMYRLGHCYENGIGVKKNEYKAFACYQKSADMGDADGMNRLGLCYENGFGVGKDEHKAFIYYRKSADMGDAQGTNNVGYCYRNGIGVEKDEHKAFIYYQKSADMGNISGTHNVGVYCRDGIGVEKNETKAFEYFKKAADMGNDAGTFNVGFCYLNQIGVQMNENKVFEYFKKSADMGFNLGRLFVGDCYRNGIGVSRDINRANHWYRMGRSLIKLNDLLPENIDYKLKQLLSNEKYKLTWVFYNKLKNIRKIGNGGFSTVYYAYWYNENRGLWTHVAVKLIHGSNELIQEFINELERYCEIGFENPSFLECYGISRDEGSKDYMIVLSYAREGSLRQNLQKVAQMKWMDRLNLLHCVASDLELIHSHELVHCDLHSGNILQHNLRSAYITDLGLSSDKEKDGKVCGVLPYVAPEVLLSGKFTQPADIYSFGIIMTEISTGKRAFDGELFSRELTMRICQGERPEFDIGTPDCYVELAIRCMDKAPDNRPTATTIDHYIGYWIDIMSRDYDNEIKKQFLEADRSKPKMTESNNCNEPKNSIEPYTSKFINTREITEGLSKLTIPYNL